MTVIAFDGRTLAADKRATAGGLHRLVTKLRRINGYMVGISGEAGHMEPLWQWFASGAKPEEWPKFQEKDDRSDMLTISPTGRILKYEATPLPILFEDQIFAMGSGRDYALAAMHLGCDARKAVEVASYFDTSCGNGIDTLELE